MLLDILKLWTESKNVKEKLFWKCCLRNPQEELVLSPESAKDSGRYRVFLFLFSLVFALFSKNSFVDTYVICSQIWDHIFKTVLPKYFLLFSNLNSKMSRNMCKLQHKVRNGHFYPMEVQISSIFNLGFKIKFVLFRLGLQKHIA